MAADPLRPWNMLIRSRMICAFADSSRALCGGEREKKKTYQVLWRKEREVEGKQVFLKRRIITDKKGR